MTKLVAISGSLRRNSLNTRLLEEARTLAPPEVAIRLIRLDEIPMYNADLPEEPPSVTAFKRAIEAADGVLFSTPEYNYGIPGVLKNAIDWASRPAYASVFAHKPAAVMGAAGSPVGTARAQAQLKQVLLGMLCIVYPCPELTVGAAGRKFGEDGRLMDEAVKERLVRLVREFAEFAQRVN